MQLIMYVINLIPPDYINTYISIGGARWLCVTNNHIAVGLFIYVSLTITDNDPLGLIALLLGHRFRMWIAVLTCMAQYHACVDLGGV